MHQHLSLQQIADKITAEATARQGNHATEEKPLVDRFHEFKAHVDNEQYLDGGALFERDHLEIENAWPNYKDSGALLLQQPHERTPINGSDFEYGVRPPLAEGSLHHILSGAEPLVAVTQDGVQWKDSFKHVVVRAQLMLHHHVHPPGTDDERVPLPGCQSKSKPGICKGRYPRDNEEVDVGVVVCPSIATQMDLPISGRRNMLGSLMGPRNNPWLNGTHPALVYDLRCNSDTLITYRLPVMIPTHSALCANPNCLEART